jgi:hypothetical protein
MSIESQKEEAQEWFNSLTVDERQHIRWLFGTPGEGHLMPEQIVLLWRLRTGEIRLSTPDQSREQERQPFERHTELAATIEWFANNVPVPGSKWNELLRNINLAVSPPDQSREQEELWNHVISRVAAADISAKVNPSDTGGLKKWKEDVMNELKKTIRLTKI